MKNLLARLLPLIVALTLCTSALADPGASDAPVSKCIDAYKHKIALIRCKRLLTSRKEKDDPELRNQCGYVMLPNRLGLLVIADAFSVIPGVIIGGMIAGQGSVLAAAYVSAGAVAGPAVLLGLVGVKETVLAIRESRHEKVLSVLEELHDPQAREEGRHLKKLFKKVTGLDPKLYADSYENYLKFLVYTEEREYLCRDRLFTYGDFKSWLREAWIPYKHDWLM